MINIKKSDYISRLLPFTVMVLLGYYWCMIGMMSHAFWYRTIGKDYIQQVDQMALFVANNWHYIFVVYGCTAFASLLIRWEKFWIFNAMGMLLIWTSSAIIMIDGFKGGMCLHHDSEFEVEIFLSAFGGFYPITLMMIALYVWYYAKLRLTSRLSEHVTGS